MKDPRSSGAVDGMLATGSSLGLTIFGWLLIATAPIRAQASGGFALEVRAPASAGCPTAERLSALVEQRTGEPSTVAGARWQIAVTIEARADHHRATLVTQDAGRSAGTRVLDAEEGCAALEQMLTLVIASSIGVIPVSVGEAREPERFEPQSSSRALPLEKEPAHEQAARPLAPWWLDIAVSAHATTGVFPTLSAGPSLAVFAGRNSLELGLSATWLPPADYRAPTGLRWRGQGAWGGLDGCAAIIPPWRGRLSFCAGMRAGALHATARGLGIVTPRWDALVQLVPSVRARFAVLPRLGVSAALAAGIPLIFPQYTHADAADRPVLDHSVQPGIWAELGIWIRAGS